MQNQEINAEPGGRVQLFTIEQPDVREIMSGRQPGPVYKRIAATGLAVCRTPQETRRFVEDGLRARHWENYPAFDPAVFDIIHEYSGGLPQRICTISNHLLLHSFIEQNVCVTVASAAAVARELARKDPLPNKVPEDTSYDTCGNEQLEEALRARQPTPGDRLPVEKVAPQPSPETPVAPPVEAPRLTQPTPGDRPPPEAEGPQPPRETPVAPPVEAPRVMQATPEDHLRVEKETPQPSPETPVDPPPARTKAVFTSRNLSRDNARGRRGRW